MAHSEPATLRDKKCCRSLAWDSWQPNGRILPLSTLLLICSPHLAAVSQLQVKGEQGGGAHGMLCFCSRHKIARARTAGHIGCSPGTYVQKRPSFPVPHLVHVGLCVCPNTYGFAMPLFISGSVGRWYCRGQVAVNRCSKGGIGLAALAGRRCGRKSTAAMVAYAVCKIPVAAKNTVKAHSPATHTTLCVADICRLPWPTSVTSLRHITWQHSWRQCLLLLHRCHWGTQRVVLGGVPVRGSSGRRTQRDAGQLDRSRAGISGHCALTRTWY